MTKPKIVDDNKIISVFAKVKDSPLVDVIIDYNIPFLPFCYKCNFYLNSNS